MEKCRRGKGCRVKDAILDDGEVMLMEPGGSRAAIIF